MLCQVYIWYTFVYGWMVLMDDENRDELNSEFVYRVKRVIFMLLL